MMRPFSILKYNHFLISFYVVLFPSTLSHLLYHFFDQYTIIYEDLIMIPPPSSHLYQPLPNSPPPSPLFHQNTITYEDLVAFAEETGDLSAIRDAGPALEVLDIDGDGVIGLLDFIHFAARLKGIYLRTKAEAELERDQRD